MFKVQSHTPCGCPCACAVACLHPHNSNSNVVVSVTIHVDMYKYICERCSKNMKPLWKVKGSFNRTSWKVSDLRIVRYTWVVSLSLCVSVSLCQVMHRLVTCVALVHTCFRCSQTCRAQLITLPTHSRWLKSCPKIELHLTW